MQHFHVAETVSQFRRARVYLGEEMQLGQTIKTIPLRRTTLNSTCQAFGGLVESERLDSSGLST